MKLADVDAEIERILSEEIDRATGELSEEVEARLDADYDKQATEAISDEDVPF